METGIARARLDSAPPDRFVALRRALGVSSFGLNQVVLKPGQRGRIHAHARQEEVYLVLSGTLTVMVEGEAHELGEGEAIRIAPEIKRQMVNRGPGDCSLIALGGAGEHDGRDGLAYGDWSDTEARTPQETPLPDDLPASELRS